MEYDAILKKPYVHEIDSSQVLVGAIYEDKKNGFKDGTVVRTSEVQATIEKDGCKYVQTRNSLYLIEEN